jgi:hypothetical protein
MKIYIRLSFMNNMCADEPKQEKVRNNMVVVC